MILAAGATGGAHAGILNLAHLGAQTGSAQAAVAARGITNLGVGVSPQQALQASQPSIRNLATAAQGIAQQIAAQQAAATAGAAAPSNVPNGLASGGLQVASGITFIKDANGNLVSQNTDVGNPNNSSADPGSALLWYNAYGPQQTVNANGTVTVNVKQTAEDAILTWQTMNVGKQTTLNFDQSGGTQTDGANNWVVLNRIMDPSGLPSQILGNVNAQGTVLVINRNGILFGAGSQVNVHSLVASSLDLLNTTDDASSSTSGVVIGNLAQSAAGIVASNQAFLNGGLAVLEAGTSSTVGVGGAGSTDPTEILGLGNNVTITSASQLQMPGDVTIAPGASITTSADGSVSNGGFVLIAAPNVNNGGSITVAPTGQVILAAGIGVSLIPNPITPQLLQPELTGKVLLQTPTGTTDITPAGTLTNTGIVQAARGNINLLGSSVTQDGVLGVTTDVNTPGNITISTVDESIADTPSDGTYPGQFRVNDTVISGGIATNRAGQLVFGDGSVTTVMPDTDGETATSSPGQTTFTPGSVTITADSVWFQSGSLIEAPGSTVTVAALTPGVFGVSPATPPGDTAVPGRIYVDTGAIIDVSGLANVQLPISDILLDVGTINENDLADSPLLRDSFLNGLKGVVVDSTLSGTSADGLQWVGSPILNLSGAVSLIPRTVDQLLTNGGTITLSGNEVMTADGSSLNLNGGYIHYLGGMVNTTRLVDANGAIVPIGQASPFDTYVGIAGEFVESHPRWGVTDDWFNPLLSGGVYEGDYIVGGNAGTLNVFASSAMVLDGEITAQAFAGSKQVQGNDQPAGGTFNLGAATLASGSTLPGLTQSSSTSVNGESGTVILQDSAPQLSDLSSDFSATTPLDTAALGALSDTDPDNVLATTVVPVNTLDTGGFANVNVTEDGTPGESIGKGILVAAGTQLTVQPGGSIKLNTPVSDVTVLGSLIAPSGTISISSGGGIGGQIVVGPNSVISASGQWVNNDTQTAPGTTPGDSEYINGGSITLSTSGNGPIVLQAGSVLDVSSGGELQSNGQMLMQNGIAQGLGGSVSLVTNAGLPTEFAIGGGSGPILPVAPPAAPLIQMDGTINSFGFSGGGTLTLGDYGFQIGGDPAQAPSWAEYLPANFFARQGFGKYVLNAIYDTTVAPGATVMLTQQNLLPDVPALQQLATGGSVAAGGLTSVGTLDPFHRQATDLVMTGGGFLVGPAGLPAGATGGVTVGEGASIIGDPGASIGLGSPVQVTVLGSIIAPGGSITLTADSLPNDSAFPGEVIGDDGFTGYTSASKSVWLGANAVLDVAGVAVTNPLAAPAREGLQTVIPDTGKVLPGGTVVISDDSGYVVAQAGSVIDVSGTSATLDELQANGQYAAQPVWSDAGSITLAASSGLLFDGTLQAQPGAAQAQGGSLTILPEQGVVKNADQPGGGTLSSPPASVLVLQQSGDLVPAGLQPGQSFADAISPTTGEVIGSSTGVLQFAVDRLSGSGVGTLVLGEANVPAPASVVFVGNVDLTLSNSVEINTGQLAALNASQLNTLLTTAPPTPGSVAPSVFSTLLAAQPGVSEPVTGALTSIGTTISINAPYVALIGPTPVPNSAPFAPVRALADGTLNINASFIDLENQFQMNNFGQANFTSSGDIRLTSTYGDSTLTPGELFTPGNLTFKAADLYPSTGSTFILDAVGPTDSTTSNPKATTITFLPDGTSGVPLSAGGTLLIDATDIVQSGTVRAPSGTLVFGVGDPKDATTVTQFNSLPLVATDSVSLTNGSVTSVSLDGVIVPYGTTVDGVEWQFNPVPGESLPDVTAPPSKFVSVNGDSVALNPGATIDLSGGGDLQAEEWVQGTGGTRDVLSQFNVSFATNPSGTAIPVNVGGGNIYAILPGAQSPVAAYDPVFAQTAQPSTNANGTSSGTATEKSGVGQAALNNTEVGESVYLSGVPGLPAGMYTLLPAKYATLPGAFRVTVSSESGAVAPGSSQTLPDGTVVTAGYIGNALTGSRSATPTLFDVQSAAVWQQYSQYTLTSANAFFPPLAAGAGNVTPPLPMDAGQLVLAATNGLTLGATLNTAPAPGGAPAEVDIASQDIQIIGTGETALPGYLQISADQLDALDAGSLLIGGTRTQTTGGITIDAIANSVVVSNDPADPLTGPEVILVTKSGSTRTDPNAANGLRVDGGSVIDAQGTYPAAKDLSITIGQNADATTNATAVSGDGALLEVSNGAASVVTRVDTSGMGLLTVGAGATLAGGQALTLDSSGNLTFDPAATLSGKTIAVDGSAITFTDQTGAAAAALPGFVVGPTQLAQLAAAQQVILRSAGVMSFDGDVDVTFGDDVDLSAGSFSSNGGAVTINAQEVAFTNETGATAPTATVGAGTLTVNASEIDFGTGQKTVNGFGSVSMNATGGIVGQGTGTFDFGALPVTLNAPVYLADTGSSQTIQTTGTLNLNSVSGKPLALSPLGGAISLIGGTVNDNGATIEAPAGNVSLEATTGDLTIGNGSLVSSAGVALPFFDVTEFAPAGAITLTADVGTVNVEAGSTLDFSAPSGGGAAGSLTLSAPDQVVNLAGTIKGNAAAGFTGGSFSLNTGGAVDLDNLATELASSGVNNQIVVQTGAGNLTLSGGNTLTANTVSLTANGGAGNASDTANGNVNINGTINANGVATARGGSEGGTIDLYGKSGVDVEGTLLAEGSDAYIAGATGPTINPNSAELGGMINIGTSGTPTANSYNTQYGYENVTWANSGAITLGASARIDVSGGGPVTFAADGLEGGTVNLRAPLLSDAATNGGYSVRANAEMTGPGAGITGTGNGTDTGTVNLEPYAVWSTTDGTTGAQHFDGIVDPAGWYQAAGPNATPQLVQGTFTDQNGNTIDYQPGTYVAANGSTPAHWTPATLSNDPNATWAQIKTDLANDLENDFFTPDAGKANTGHQVFYGDTTTTNSDGSTTIVPGTLMGFVENGETGVVSQFAANAIHFNVTPGIELDSPSPAINNGNISVVTNWNLGAGSSPTDQLFRFDGQAPIITFRAVNNVEVDASLTDGFFQIANPVNPGSSVSVSVPPLQTYGEVQGLLSAPTKYYDIAYYLTADGINGAFAGIVTAPPENLGTSAADEEYYTLYSAYLSFLISPLDSKLAPIAGLPGGTTYVNLLGDYWTSAPNTATAPVAPSPDVQAKNPAAYLEYLVQYQAYVDEVGGIRSKLAPPTAPTAQAVAVVNPSTTDSANEPDVTPAVADNTPSPVATATNPLPLEVASLTTGTSSSFRVVAGANLASADPLALQAASVFDTTDGNVGLDGHFAFVDSNGLALMAPTMIRTGTGSIDIAAGNDIALLDTSAPGVIYTAGEPAAGAPVGSTASILKNPGAGDILVTPTVNPESAGNILIYAQNDITGIEDVVDTTGAISGFAGNILIQSWSQWMQVGNPTNSAGQTTQTSINFGSFDQGVMSVGGNVSVSAGGNISDLGVSLPTTWYQTSLTTFNTVGGGNLTVTAGGNILSGDYFVANGTGTIVAGGQIASDFATPTGLGGAPVSQATLFATQDGVLDVNARLGANIGGVSDPSPLQSFSPTSAVSIESTTGDIDFGAGGEGSLPATVNLVALTGGITVASGGTLAPSPTGNLNLIADQSIGLSTSIGLSDENPADVVSPVQQSGSTNNEQDDHDDSPLHANDTVPARIYSLTGSIVDGILEPAGSGSDAGFYDRQGTISVDKSALIDAGQDIVDLSFQGQNLRDSDVTRIVAGHDIYDTPFASGGGALVPSLVLGGPGTFDIEAGHNIGPLTQAGSGFGEAQAGVAPPTGIDAIGNGNNPNLPHESANVQVLFGVAPGIDDTDFISTYINPASTAAGVPSTTPALIAFMEQYDEGQEGVDTGLVADAPKPKTLTAGEAWSQFQLLPTYAQQLFVGQVFFSVLTDVGNDFNNPASPFFSQYARGFQAINTLFPASLGYTANDLTGGTNGANAPVSTGNLDIRSSTIQTQQGGNVSILGPGGEALVGSSSAPPEIVSNGVVIAGPGTMGILTLEKGDINIFTDQSLLLAQSRVFTEQGGDITIWSSNGDINAGQGSTTVANIPPPEYVCDANHFCTLDAKGEVTGAGIGTLQTIPDAPTGNANLLAPRGTVDAGAAGIRVSGNLNVAALQVLNVANIQVQGKTTGVPVVAAVDTGALTAASSAASAVTQMAQNIVRNNASGVPQRQWVVTVEVEGFGNSDLSSDSDDLRRGRARR
ncbi:filamentous haemagglutinin family protein [Paraburkholderia sp. BCC1885]|uniref:filamentous haemagglutinin family protein n=1 Tax=Paraburkholderia sp. BCC1885 TaxID=2562669 RepID=UPI0021B31E34|nr:filamentous haemagglutinin family protein [Paraburkholderia sp. BCC1885]